MLKDVDPVRDREGRRQYKEDHQFRRGDAEQEEIGKPSPKNFRNVRGHLSQGTV